MMMAIGLVPILALLIDRLCGEPPVAVHPVVWMGRLLTLLQKIIPDAPASSAFLAGAMGWWVGAVASVALACLLQLWVLDHVTAQLPRRLPEWAGVALQAIILGALLKPLLSLRLLREEALAVETALERSLDDGRKRTARICSRETQSLDATTLRETAIESVSENLVDSVVAPLFWFAVAGLPGAALYRWANTADAMWGYRDARHEWSGKFAARVDDALSWIPARLSVLLMWPTGQGARLQSEASRTPSPNGGWPMAATAFALGIRLGKPGAYTLNSRGREVNHGDIALAAALCERASWRFAIASGALAIVVYSLPVSGWAW